LNLFSKSITLYFILILGNDKNCPICYTSFNDNTFDHDDDNLKRRFIKFSDNIETISFNNVPKRLPNYIPQSFNNNPSNHQNSDMDYRNKNKEEIIPSTIIKDQIRSKYANDIIKTKSIDETFKISGSMGSLNEHYLKKESNTERNSNSNGTGSSW